MRKGIGWILLKVTTTKKPIDGKNAQKLCYKFVKNGEKEINDCKIV